jgi:hypothetical protein
LLDSPKLCIDNLVKMLLERDLIWIHPISIPRRRLDVVRHFDRSLVIGWARLAISAEKRRRHFRDDGGQINDDSDLGGRHLTSR